MKAVLVLLAVLCSAFADHHEGHGPEHECLHQCREQIKAKIAEDSNLSQMAPDRLTTPEGRTKVRQFIRNYIAGTGPIMPGIQNSETWTKMCSIATTAESCMDACQNVDANKREGIKNFLSVYKLGCDEEFKSSLPCLIDAYKQPSESCQTKCTPLASKLTDFLTQRDANPEERVPAPKDVLESGCKFMNCRLNCRKPDIVNKCQEKGFEQSKKLISAMANSNKMLYKRGGGDLANWPDECKSDKVVENHEY